MAILAREQWIQTLQHSLISVFSKQVFYIELLTHFTSVLPPYQNVLKHITSSVQFFPPCTQVRFEYRQLCSSISKYLIKEVFEKNRIEEIWKRMCFQITKRREYGTLMVWAYSTDLRRQKIDTVVSWGRGGHTKFNVGILY